MRALLAAGLTLILAGCAGRPPETEPQNNAPDAAARGSAVPLRTAPTPVDHAALMVVDATAMLGQPYRYGGAAPGGFDCSGLVAYAAGNAGLHIPRTAHEQLQAGMYVRRSELQAGDLVFMRLAHKELHVGIAIDNERFIHAPATGGHVRMDSLAASPYSAGFIEARRIALP